MERKLWTAALGSPVVPEVKITLHGASGSRRPVSSRRNAAAPASSSPPVPEPVAEPVPPRTGQRPDGGLSAPDGSIDRTCSRPATPSRAAATAASSGTDPTNTIRVGTAVNDRATWAGAAVGYTPTTAPPADWTASAPVAQPGLVAPTTPT